MKLKLRTDAGESGQAYGFASEDGAPFDVTDLVETDLDLLRCCLEAMLAAVYADDEEHERKAVHERRFLDIERLGNGRVARVGDEVSGSYPIEAIRYGVTASGSDVLRYAPPLVRTQGGYEPTEDTEEQ